MLDRLLNKIATRLDAAAAAVRDQRAELERERAGDTSRQYAGTMLKNSEGYSTTLRAAAQNSQKEYALLRREWEKEGLPAMALLTALVIGRERRDEAREAYLQHKKDEATRLDTGVHLDVRACFAAMYEHGVEPRHLATVRPEMIAIVSDLLRWDGHDPETSDPDSPLAQVFAIYANRSILKPGQVVVEPRSAPGVPPRAVRYTDPVYYMFDELIPKAFHGAEAAVAKTAGADIIDAPIYAIEPPDIAVDIATSSDPVDLGMQLLTPLSAKAYAERIADHRMAAYWPEEGGEYRSYDMDKLLPALRRSADSGEAPAGVAMFSDAASNGRAREFFEDVRERIITKVTTELLAGDDRALADARSLNLPV